MLEPAKMLDSDRTDLSAATLAPSAPRRLLVIDDDNLHRMIICRAAAKAGYLPAGAASYDEAVNLAAEVPFDAISLDLSLGERAGVELLRHLWVIGCKAPIIIISGCDGPTCSATTKLAESLKLTVWESIAKPVNLAMLRTSLGRLKAACEEAATLAPLASPGAAGAPEGGDAEYAAGFPPYPSADDRLVGRTKSVKT